MILAGMTAEDQSLKLAFEPGSAANPIFSNFAIPY